MTWRWVNDDRFSILGWPIPLNMHLLPKNECFNCRVWLSEDVIFADHVSYQISQINQSLTTAMPGMCRVIALVDKWQRIPKQICQIMIYYLKGHFTFCCKGTSSTFSLMAYSQEGQASGSIESMFPLITCDIFVLISFSPRPQINFVADLPFQTRDLEPQLLLTVMKYMFKKKVAH